MGMLLVAFLARGNHLWSCRENDVHFEPNKIACSLMH